MSLRRFARSWLVIAAAALVVALPAGAKNGMQATLVTPVPTKALAGSTFRVAWIVTDLDRGHRELFGAGGMFVRLVSPLRGESLKVYAKGVNGRYHATVHVPHGGMRGIQLGFRAWTTNPIQGGMTEIDAILPITDDPFRTKNSPSR